MRSLRTWLATQEQQQHDRVINADRKHIPPLVDSLTAENTAVSATAYGNSSCLATKVPTSSNADGITTPLTVSVDRMLSESISIECQYRGMHRQHTSS